MPVFHFRDAGAMLMPLILPPPCHCRFFHASLTLPPPPLSSILIFATIFTPSHSASFHDFITRFRLRDGTMACRSAAE